MNAAACRPQPARASRALLAAAALAGAAETLAWVYPEHREIALVAVKGLDAQRAAAFDKLWNEARFGHEQRLCERAAEHAQGTTPACLDWAALPAIAGDHSCSSKDKSEWILGVTDVAAQLKLDLARVPVVPPPG